MAARQLSTLKLMGMITLFAVIGIPLVAYLWETLNRVLALEFDPLRLAISAGVLVLFLGLLLLLKKNIQAKEPRT